MQTKTFKGRDFFSWLDFTKEEMETMLDVALNLKHRTALGEFHDHILRNKSLFMFFYNRSLRTRNSFECGMTQLGGQANYLDTDKVYTPAVEGKEVAYVTERVSDVAQVLSRIGHAISIRCYGKPVNWEYGAANYMLHEFAKWSDIPIINMEDDMYHPTQALADAVTVKEKFGGFKGVKFVMSWAYSPSVHKPRAVPQSSIIMATKLGMDVVLAHPEGMEVDPNVITACEKYAAKNDSSFEISNDFKDSMKGAHVVYPKAWAPTCLFQPPVGEGDAKKGQEIFDAHKDWKCDQSIMDLADKNAVYMHCLPADRGFEATNDVIDGPQSVIFDEAENRLHSIKAILSLLL